MIEVVDRKGNAVRLRASGKVSDEDYEKVLVPAIEAVLKENDKVSCQIEFSGEYRGFELGAMWEDAKFGLKHRRDFTRCSVVGAPKWMEWGVKVGDKLTGAKLKTYPSEQAEDAWNWVSQ